MDAVYIFLVIDQIVFEMTEQNLVNSVIILFFSHKKIPENKNFEKLPNIFKLPYFGQMTETSQQKEKPRTL